jgi:hypothetical protein
MKLSKNRTQQEQTGEIWGDPHEDRQRSALGTGQQRLKRAAPKTHSVSEKNNFTRKTKTAKRKTLILREPMLPHTSRKDTAGTLNKIQQWAAGQTNHTRIPSKPSLNQELEQQKHVVDTLVRADWARDSRQPGHWGYEAGNGDLIEKRKSWPDWARDSRRPGHWGYEAGNGDLIEKRKSSPWTAGHEHRPARSWQYKQK